jgi:hypothetical protein
MSTFIITFDEDSSITPGDAKQAVLDFVKTNSAFDSPSAVGRDGQAVEVELNCFDADGTAKTELRKWWKARDDVHNVR